MSEYGAMEAGREMDAAVAQRVMGWTHVGWRTQKPPHGDARRMLYGRSPAWNERRPRGGHGETVPRISRDLALAYNAAGRVFDWFKLRRYEDHTAAACARNGEDGGMWHGKADGTDAEAAALALCRAMLMWADANEEGEG